MILQSTCNIVTNIVTDTVIGSRIVTKQVAVQDPDQEVIEEVTFNVGQQVPNPAWTGNPGVCENASVCISNCYHNMTNDVSRYVCTVMAQRAPPQMTTNVSQIATDMNKHASFDLASPRKAMSTGQVCPSFLISSPYVAPNSTPLPLSESPCMFILHLSLPFK